MKIYAATRLIADTSWFDELTDAEKKSYVEKHPNSKLAEDYDNLKSKEWEVEQKNPQNKQEEIAELKDQINQLIDDIKDFEADGEDTTKERKLLRGLKARLAEINNA